MKTPHNRLLIVWHVLLAVLVISGFMVYHNLVVRGVASKHLDNSLNEGISVSNLISIVFQIETNQPESRIQSVEKEGLKINIVAAWITNSYRQNLIEFKEIDGSWKKVETWEDVIEGISPTELKSILDIIASESVDEDKRILSVSMQHGTVLVAIGPTNYSRVGGGPMGLMYEFDRKETKWVLEGRSHWESARCIEPRD